VRQQVDEMLDQRDLAHLFQVAQVVTDDARDAVALPDAELALVLLQERLREAAEVEQRVDVTRAGVGFISRNENGCRALRNVATTPEPLRRYDPPAQPRAAQSCVQGPLEDGRGRLQGESFTARNRRALAMTETELTLIAAPAIIGLSKTPANG
jgi:hypothetical protein